MSEQPLGSLWRVTAVRHLMVVSLLGFASYCLTLASLPSWALHGGSSRATAGLVTTVMLVTTVAAQGLVPAAILRIGSGPALALGLLLLGAPAPLYGLSSSLAPLLVLSAIRGVGFALLTVIGATLTGDVAPISRRGEAIGIYGLSIALPNLVGVPAGVALTQAGHFATVAVLAACPVLAVPFALRLGRSPDPAAAVRPGPDGSDALSHRGVLIVALAPSIVLMLVTAAGGGLVTFLPIERPSGALATLALLVFGATAAVARWRAGILVDRVGSRLLLPTSLLAASAGMGAVALCLVGGSAYDVLLVVGAAVFGFGYGAVQNVTLVIAFARAGAAGAATASALWNGAFDTGTALGAFAVGAIAAAGLGLPWSFAVSAAAILVVLPVALAMRAPARPAGPPESEAFA
jgi:predicted MFS family arabinose efflux permease